MLVQVRYSIELSESLTQGYLVLGFLSILGEKSRYGDRSDSGKILGEKSRYGDRSDSGKILGEKSRYGDPSDSGES